MGSSATLTHCTHYKYRPTLPLSLSLNPSTAGALQCLTLVVFPRHPSISVYHHQSRNRSHPSTGLCPYKTSSIFLSTAQLSHGPDNEAIDRIMGCAC